MARYAGVLFDVDDTLYDRAGAQRLILRDMCRQLPDLFGETAIDQVEAAFSESDRRTADHVFTTENIAASRDQRSRLFLELLGRPADRARQVSEAYTAAYRRTACPVRHAAEVVERCARHLPVGIVSNAFPDVQYHKIDSLGIRGLCACILLSEEVGVRKPEAAIFVQGCRALGTEPAQTLYVGDSYGNDVVGAARAGLASCWFNPARRPPGPAGVVPDYEARELDEVCALLELPA